MSGPYNGHILEFPQIRVDCFTPPPPASKPQWLLPDPYDPSAPPRNAPPAQLYLLTHVHTDHLMGLSNDFTGHILCSADTKRLLPRLEAEVERDRIVNGVREVSRKKYDKLRPKILDKGTKDERVVDRVEALPYGVPKVFELGYEDGKPLRVTITLLEANHCPGSTMFLIASHTRAVLHTGDIRADHLFLQTLRRNPALGEFVEPWSKSAIAGKGNSARRTLDRIYLDTGAVLGTGDMPDREDVVRDLIDQMELYPPDTTFFLNVWCLGWEDVIKEVARHFGTKVLVDRYKRELYEAVQTDPFLTACTTISLGETRFHACERAARCVDCRKFAKGQGRVYNTDKLIVDVVMVEVKQASWEVEHREFLDKLGKAATGEGAWPYQIQCPIARHSPLPELQSLVKMFQPNALTPNIIAKELNGIDYYTFPDLFRDCVPDKAYQQTKLERNQWFAGQKRFGSAFLQTMKGMKMVGLNLAETFLSDNGQSQFSPVSGPLVPSALSADVKVGAVGRNRRAYTMEQVSRAGGLPQISVEDSKAILAALSGNHQTSAHDQPLVQGRKLGGLGGAKEERKLPFTSVPMRKKEEDEYDTEEERATSMKRRRVMPTLNDIPIPNAKVKLEPDVPMIRDQMEVKVRQSSASPAAEDVQRSIRMPRSSLPRRTFMVDKAHLRALAMVTADVDDL